MAIPLRADCSAEQLRSAAKVSKDAAQVRRLLALAAIYDGASRTEAAWVGPVTVQIARDWVVKFNAQGPAGLIDLCQWLWEEHQVMVAKRMLSRELRRMGYRKPSARPRHHAQREGAIDAFEETSPRTWTRSGARRVSSLAT